MERHFERELESLKTNLIKMASLAENAVRDAITAVIEHRHNLAENVIRGDQRINALEMEIDNAIFDLLALQQPVATDLRLILAAQTINDDLERIGDHAVNIAESALALCQTPAAESLLELPKMAELALQMLRNALDSFIHKDPDLGRAVLENDDLIDELNRMMTREVIQLMKTHQESIEGGLELVRVSKNLERVADLATNISEEVIFLAQAKVVKHHAQDQGGQAGSATAEPSST